jgi:hypothetical protein
MANRKQGSMTAIIAIDARLVPVLSLSRKKSGKPNRRAAAKHTICRLVRLNATFVLTLDKSLGTGTYAKKKPPFSGFGVAVIFHKGNQGKCQFMPFARPYFMGVIRVKVGSYFRRFALKISTLPLTRR